MGLTVWYWKYMCRNLPSPMKRSTSVEQCLAQNKAPGKLSQRQWHWRVGSLLKGRDGNEGETAKARQKDSRKGWGGISGKLDSGYMGRNKRRKHSGRPD